MHISPRGKEPDADVAFRVENVTKPDSPATWWFGGGSDLTPSYLFPSDAVHFHRTLSDACSRSPLADSYPRLKKACDAYFYNKHRAESRGIGGIFFDDVGDDKGDRDELFEWIKGLGGCFLDSYVPIVEKRWNADFGEKEKRWQALRRAGIVSPFLGRMSS
jgi:coproporphyrinogen III oxidase